MHDVFVLELYSGNADVGRIAGTMLSCPVESVDADARWRPTILAELPRDTGKVIAAIKFKHPGRRCVMFASPPCAHYSVARTTGGERDLLAADARVAAVHVIAAALDAVVTVIENPRTGLLKSRAVIGRMPFKFAVDYCRYGKLYRKQTMIWCSHDLSAYDFSPRVCCGDCDATYHRAALRFNSGPRRHVLCINDVDFAERISIPEALIASIFRAVCNIVRELPDPMDGVLQQRPRTPLALPTYSKSSDDASCSSDASYSDASASSSGASSSSSQSPSIEPLRLRTTRMRRSAAGMVGAYQPCAERPRAIDVVSDCRRNADTGIVEVLVSWKGHDHIEWVAAADLDCNASGYSFISKAVLARYDRLTKRSRAATPHLAEAKRRKPVEAQLLRDPC